MLVFVQLQLKLFESWWSGPLIVIHMSCNNTMCHFPPAGAEGHRRSPEELETQRGFARTLATRRWLRKCLRAPLEHLQSITTLRTEVVCGGECRGGRVGSEPLRKWQRVMESGGAVNPALSCTSKEEKLTSTFPPPRNSGAHESSWSPCGGRSFRRKAVIPPPPIFSFSFPHLHLPDQSSSGDKTVVLLLWNKLEPCQS